MSPRFSPPRDKADLLRELVGKDSPFNELRDILFFAAVIGWNKQRREPLGARGEAIRWDVMTNRFGTEIIMDMIAVATKPDDKELLSDARVDERVEILEEYANGGLQVLQELVSTAGALPLQTVFIHLIQDQLRDETGARVGESLADKVLNL